VGNHEWRLVKSEVYLALARKKDGVSGDFFRTFDIGKGNPVDSAVSREVV